MLFNEFVCSINIAVKHFGNILLVTQSYPPIRTRIIQFVTPKDSIAIDYLGFLATLPYDGSDPQQAREWIENTLPRITGNGDVKETIIGNIRFQLYGSSSNMSLKIGEDL